MSDDWVLTPGDDLRATAEQIFADGLANEPRPLARAAIAYCRPQLLAKIELELHRCVAALDDEPDPAAQPQPGRLRVVGA